MNARTSIDVIIQPGRQTVNEPVVRYFAGQQEHAFIASEHGVVVGRSRRNRLRDPILALHEWAVAHRNDIRHARAGHDRATARP